MCPLTGYLKLTRYLKGRRIKSIDAKCFCLDHVLFYVSLIRQYWINVTEHFYEWKDYIYMDENSNF